MGSQPALQAVEPGAPDVRRMRAIALALITNGDRILVAEGHDPVKGETFYRPLGGSIEFGERGAEAVVRELREEMGVEAADARYLGTLENLFVYNGQPGHEIVMVYEVRLVDRWPYGQDEIECNELGTSFRAVWMRLDEFGPGAPLYPEGLYELAAASIASVLSTEEEAG